MANNTLNDQIDEARKHVPAKSLVDELLHREREERLRTELHDALMEAANLRLTLVKIALAVGCAVAIANLIISIFG